MIQLDFQSRSRTFFPTPAPGVVRNPTPYDSGSATLVSTEVNGRRLSWGYRKLPMDQRLHTANCATAPLYTKPATSQTMKRQKSITTKCMAFFCASNSRFGPFLAFFSSLSFF